MPKYSRAQQSSIIGTEVGDSVGAAVGDSVGAEVGDSVGAEFSFVRSCIAQNNCVACDRFVSSTAAESKVAPAM